MSIAVASGTWAPGDTFDVSGTGCGPDNADFVDHQINVTLVQQTTGIAYGNSVGGVSSTGTWSVPLTASLVAPAGDYEVRGVCQATTVATGTPIGLVGPSVSVTMVSPIDAVTMTVTPTSGVRPLTVEVLGSRCEPTDAEPRTVTVQLLDPSLSLVTELVIEGNGGEWSATFVIGVARINPYTVRAVCSTPDGAVVAAYPDQQVQVDTEPPQLLVSVAGDGGVYTGTATADQCPDPELPQLGGSYSVRFVLSLTDEVVAVPSTSAGVATVTFDVPSDLQGSSEVTATCQLEELGQTLTLFTYEPATFAVPQPVDVFGDVNCDDVMNILDALLIARYEAELATDSGGCPRASITEIHVASGDVDNSGTTDIIDALLIARCEVGLPSVACAPEG